MIISRYSLLNKLYKLQDLFEQNTHSDKRLTMLYSVSNGDILVTTNKELKTTQSILDEHHIVPIVDTIENSSKARMFYNRRLWIEDVVFKELVEDMIKYIEKDNR